MTSRVTMTLIVATSLLAAGCSHPPTLEARCGEAVVPIADELVLPNEPLDADAKDAIVELNRRYAEAGAEYDFSDRYEWFVAERSPDQLVLFGIPLEPLTPDAPGYASYNFQGGEGSWSLYNGGQCRIEVTAPGFTNARWVFDPAIEPDPTSNELALLIYEHSCASGKAPIGREILPVVVEEDEVVTITVLVEPVSGFAFCPVNVWHPIVVELDGPVAGRSLFDGSTLPFLGRTWPPTQASLDSARDAP